MAREAKELCCRRFNHSKVEHAEVMQTSRGDHEDKEDRGRVHWTVDSRFWWRYRRASADPCTSIVSDPSGADRLLAGAFPLEKTLPSLPAVDRRDRCRTFPRGDRPRQALVCAKVCNHAWCIAVDVSLQCLLRHRAKNARKNYSSMRRGKLLGPALRTGCAVGSAPQMWCARLCEPVRRTGICPLDQSQGETVT